jgi:hypothetical protein
MTSAIAFIMGIFLIWYVTDSMKETKNLYEILLSTEKNEEVKSQLKDLYEKSKRTNKKYLIIFAILLAISVAVSVTDLIAIISK